MLHYFLLIESESYKKCLKKHKTKQNKNMILKLSYMPRDRDQLNRWRSDDKVIVIVALFVDVVAIDRDQRIEVSCIRRTTFFCFRNINKYIIRINQRNKKTALCDCHASTFWCFGILSIFFIIGLQIVKKNLMCIMQEG